LYANNVRHTLNPSACMLLIRQELLNIAYVFTTL
jgi:hypothetical protein